MAVGVHRHQAQSPSMGVPGIVGLLGIGWMGRNVHRIIGEPHCANLMHSDLEHDPSMFLPSSLIPCSLRK